MKSQVFSGVDPVIGNALAPSEIVDGFIDEGFFHAGVLQEGGVTAGTVIDLASRFAVLCTQSYGKSAYELKVDRAHPNITVDCQELEDVLQANPGDTIPTPADPTLFAQLFKTASTFDLFVKPAVPNPEMPHTFASVSWNRAAGNFIKFYAQAGSTAASEDFIKSLYEKMFYVPESAPKKGIDVALGRLAAVELRIYAVGTEQHKKDMLERHINNSRNVGPNMFIGFPTASLLESSRPSALGRVRSLLGKVKKLF